MKKANLTTPRSRSVITAVVSSRRSAAATSKRTPYPAALKPESDRGHANGKRRDEENGSFDMEEVLAALIAFKRGDFSKRLPAGWTGVAGKVADTFNEVADLMSHSTQELSRISHVVGKEGR